MSLLKQIMEDGRSHQCEKCRKTFMSNMICLTPVPKDEIDFSPTEGVRFVAKDLVVCGCRNTKDVPKDAMLLTCPECNHINLSGFIGIN